MLNITNFKAKTDKKDRDRINPESYRLLDNLVILLLLLMYVRT